MRLTDNNVDPFGTTGRHIYQSESGKFYAYYDGWYQGEFNDYPIAVRSLFPYRRGGSDLEYFIDGDDWLEGPLCPDCAGALWTEGSELTEEIIETGQLMEGSIYCEFCHEEFAEGLCAYCYRPYSDIEHGLFIHDYYKIHASCLASCVVDGLAEKVGFRQYRVYKPGIAGLYVGE